MKRILVTLAIMMIASLPISAQIPMVMSYQGVLTNDIGVVVSDGDYSMTFRFYSAETGGTPFWEETSLVTVSKGIFNVTLGNLIPIEDWFDEPVYLGIEIAGGGELTPRRPFTSNAHSLSALAVYGTENIFPSQGPVGIGTTAAQAQFHIVDDISSSTEPMVLFENAGDQTLLDFSFGGPPEARIRMNGGYDLYVGTLTNGGLSFRTGDLTRMRIVSTGYVGIGQIGPQERLDVNGALRLGTTANTNAGTIRWTGSDFEGYDGATWNSLTTGGGSGLPAGTSGQTLHHDGMDWAATSNLYNNGSYVGIGTASPTSPLHVVQAAGQTGLQVDGNDASWASIYLNATGGGNPTYGYQRANTLRGHHYVDSGYNWNLVLDNDPAMYVHQSGAVAFGAALFYESMNIEGALRLGNTTGSTPGAIRYTGTDFEGYIGSSWHSLTSGGLPAGTASQTLRYNGSAWVASSNLTNTDSAIGIGTDTPAAELHLYGTDPVERIESNNATGSTAVEIKTSGGTYDYLRLEKSGPIRPGVTAGGIPLANLSRVAAGSEAGALMMQTEALEPLYFVTDNTLRMTISEDGDHLTYSEFSGSVMSVVYGGPSGYSFSMYDELGNLSGSLESDSDGGGFMALKRSATEDGFLVNGNYLGLEGTRVDIMGATTAITFNASEEGDASVELPPDALSASEILDEPGAGYDWRGVTYDLAGGITSVAGRTITVPAAGYVIVWGTAEVQIDHTSGTADHGRLGVSADEISYPSAQDNDIKLDSGLATGVYNFPVTVHGLFEVTGVGSYTYYLIGSEFSGVVSVNKSSLTALYIPTAYGTVDALSASYGRASSDSDPALERREAEAFNDVRLDRELAAMKERIAALESELGNR